MGLLLGATAFALVFAVLLLVEFRTYQLSGAPVQVRWGIWADIAGIALVLGGLYRLRTQLGRFLATRVFTWGVAVGVALIVGGLGVAALGVVAADDRSRRLATWVYPIILLLLAAPLIGFRLAKPWRWLFVFSTAVYWTLWLVVVGFQIISNDAPFGYGSESYWWYMSTAGTIVLAGSLSTLHGQGRAELRERPAASDDLGSS